MLLGCGRNGRGQGELGVPMQWSQRRAGVPPVEATGVGLGVKGTRGWGDKYSCMTL
jgi:hypothetical protein